MNKLRVATFHQLIIIGGAALFSHYRTEQCHLWLDMPTNLHVRLWELVAKISTDILSFHNSHSITISNSGKFFASVKMHHYFLTKFGNISHSTRPVLGRLSSIFKVKPDRSASFAIFTTLAHQA